MEWPLDTVFGGSGSASSESKNAAAKEGTLIDRFRTRDK